MPEQNNKLKLVRAVMLCVTLAIMAAIFLFSAQPGESSSALSQQITEKVESTAAHRLTPKWFSSQNDNANIRKWAHVYIYCALGVSTAVTVHLFGSAGKAGGAKQLAQEALISAVTCTAYAGTDEFHQLFIPGRAGRSARTSPSRCSSRWATRTTRRPRPAPWRARWPARRGG